MSIETSDFEVHPRGTAEELKVLRQMFMAMVTENESHGCLPYAVKVNIERVTEYYKQFIETK